MSNVKQISISGQMPFCIYEDERAKGWLGLIASPSIGLDISYGATSLEPNKHGGKTTMYRFSIAGAEAMRWESIELMIHDLRAAGCAISDDEISLFDMEA